MDKGFPVDSNVLPCMAQFHQGPVHEAASRAKVGTGQATEGLVPERLDENSQTNLSVSQSVSQASGGSAQSAASEVDHSAAFTALEEEGTRINAEGPRSWVDLQVAFLRNFPSMSAALQADGSNIDAAVGPGGRTALQLAVVSGSPEAVTELITNGADVNGVDAQNRTALHFTAMRGRLAMVNLLIDSKANVNAPDANGNTALHHAVAQGHIEVIEALINARADIFTSNNAGMTVVDAAICRGVPEVINLLMADLPG